MSSEHSSAVLAAQPGRGDARETFRKSARKQLAPKAEDFDFLVRGLARRYARRRADLPDFEQEGRLAVVLALRAFTPGQKTSTGQTMSAKNFVGFRIRHAMKEHARSCYRPGFVSIDAPIVTAPGEEGATRHDVIGSFDDPSIDLLAKRAVGLRSLTTRQRSAFELYLEGRTFAEVGERLNVDERNARVFVLQAQEKVAQVFGVLS